PNRNKTFEFIERNSFGLLASQVNGEPFVSHVPFLLDRSSGPNDTLVVHMAIANPQPPCCEKCRRSSATPRKRPLGFSGFKPSPFPQLTRLVRARRLGSRGRTSHGMQTVTDVKKPKKQYVRSDGREPSSLAAHRLTDRSTT